MITLLANQLTEKILSFFILLVKGRVLIPGSAFSFIGCSQRFFGYA
jgi:hypothetical protein